MEGNIPEHEETSDSDAVRKKTDACYAYELCSNLCEPYRLQAGTYKEPVYNRETLLLEERVDLDFGLLDKLLANGVLSEAQYADIKTSQPSIFRARKLLEYTQGKAEDFVTALQQTKQQHLLNYSSSKGFYDRKYGGDWPLTDRQMKTLNVHQEVLVELMEMSAQLVEILYSRHVLNKRHKEFISGQPPGLKQSEVFLDILRRRSFRDYKETIECLRLSNQKHIANIFNGGVVSRIFCVLRKPARNSIFSAKSIVNKCGEELSRWSAVGGDSKLKLTKKGLIDVRYDNGIVLYFHFKNQEELSKTKNIFCTGKLNAIAAIDFKDLLSSNPVSVVFEPPTDDFKRCDAYFRIKPFTDTNIQDCPMEMLEMILSKAYAFYFDAFSPDTRDKKLFALLSSVSRDWLKAIARRSFKTSLTECLRPYVLMGRKRNTIIRCNRKYLVEIMEPTDFLINRMEEVGCLTRMEAAFIARLPNNMAKNQELLNVARSLNFKKHFVFIESLRFCGQLKVARVLEKGGVVVKAEINHVRISNAAEYMEIVNRKLSELHTDHLEDLSEVLLLDKKKTLEILDFKHLGQRKQNERIVINLWCRSRQSLFKLRKSMESGELLKRFDILIGCLNSKDTDSLDNMLGSDRYKIESLQFVKRLTIDVKEFQKEVAVRQMSPVYMGRLFHQPRYKAKCMTSLNDKIYVMSDNLEITVHEDTEPFACQSKLFFPPLELQSNIANHRHFMMACEMTKCIYIANDRDSHLWRLTPINNELKVWMSDIGSPFCGFVTRNGDVVLVRLGDASQAVVDKIVHYRMVIYNKDAALVREILIPGKKKLEPRWGMEISTGKLFLSIYDKLFIRSADLTTQPPDPEVITFPRSLHPGLIAGVTSYCEGQLIMQISSQGLAFCDAQLHMDIIRASTPPNVNNLHFKKDKRQLIFYSPARNAIEIYTLEYQAEDMFADDS